MFAKPADGETIMALADGTVCFCVEMNCHGISNLFPTLHLMDVTPQFGRLPFDVKFGQLGQVNIHEFIHSLLQIGRELVHCCPRQLGQVQLTGRRGLLNVDVAVPAKNKLKGSKQLLKE